MPGLSGAEAVDSHLHAVRAGNSYRMRFGLPGSVLGVLLVAASMVQAANWPQFRGPNAQGISASAGRLPAEIGPETNVIWKTALPPGHSSPAVDGDRIFLTAEKDKKLLTLGLDRVTGQILWEQAAPYEKLEEIHSIGSHCQSSPATDGERVVSFFGSSGLFCYDRDGKLLWKRAFGPFKNTFGAGSSPIIVDDLVILCQDHDTDSFLMALNKKTGETVWKVDRSEFTRNYCTPVIMTVEGKKQIVLAATLRVVGYDLQTGAEIWTVRGISRFVSATPCVAPDGTVYVAAWAAGGDEGDRLSVEPFDGLIAAKDANKNGGFEESELPDGPIKMRFAQVDRDKNLIISREEYEYFRKLFELGRNVLLAIKPGGKGDVTQTHVRWEYRKFVPFCTSPVWYDGLLFTVKDGGIASCFDGATGKSHKQGRLEATGDYYSSPVAGDGKVYLLNEDGKLTVLSAEAQWQQLATADFKESAYATPALIDSKIYLRTSGHLYCFGSSQ